MADNEQERQISPNDHLAFLKLALALARRSPPKPTNYRVGALLVDGPTGAILSSGYTLELPGNTHAEQCCISKFAIAHTVDRELEIGNVLPAETVLYTTMEPCGRRLSGQMSCVDRIISVKKSAGEGKQGIGLVVYGVSEPKDFVDNEDAITRLEGAGVKCLHVTGLEEQIIAIAKEGHQAESKSIGE